MRRPKLGTAPLRRLTRMRGDPGALGTEVSATPGREDRVPGIRYRGRDQIRLSGVQQAASEGFRLPEVRVRQRPDGVQRPPSSLGVHAPQRRAGESALAGTTEATRASGWRREGTVMGL